MFLSILCLHVVVNCDRGWKGQTWKYSRYVVEHCCHLSLVTMLFHFSSQCYVEDDHSIHTRCENDVKIFILHLILMIIEPNFSNNWG